MEKYILSLCCLLTSISCFAEGWSAIISVEQLIAQDSDKILVYTSGGTQYATGCNIDNWVVKTDNIDRLNRIYTTLLTALVSGKKVRLWFKDVCDSGSSSSHLTTAVKLYK